MKWRGRSSGDTYYGGRIGPGPLSGTVGIYAERRVDSRGLETAFKPDDGFNTIDLLEPLDDEAVALQTLLTLQELDA